MLLTEPYALFVFNLVVGAVLGAVLYKSDYCMAGIFRDMFLFKHYSLLRSLLLLLAVSMALFSAARAAGLVALYPPPTYSVPTAATFIGGAVFGIGMVLAGGCVVGTLYKMAAGSLTSLVAFAGIIAGSLLYAESYPLWEALRRTTTAPGRMMLFEGAPGIERAVIGIAAIVFAVLFIRWGRQNKWRIEAYAEGYLQPWKAAVIIAVLNVLIYIFSGWPMGITTGYAKMGAYIENLFIPSRVAQLAFFNQDSLTVSLAGAALSGGAGPRADIISFTELPLALGIVAGAFCTSVLLREFKIYGLPPKRQLAAALAGGVLIGLGTRIAKGCNIKLLLGALPLFAWQGVVFVLGMVAGTYLGVVLLKRLVVPDTR